MQRAESSSRDRAADTVASASGAHPSAIAIALFAGCGDDEKTDTERVVRQSCSLEDLKGTSGPQTLVAHGVSCADARSVTNEFVVNCAKHDPCELDSGYTCRSKGSPQADSALVTCTGPQGHRVEIGVAG